LITLVITNPS